MTEEELIEIEVRLREAIRVANENPNLTWGFNVEGELLTALVAEVRRLRAMRCETCKHWERTNTESYAEYGKCAFWHRIARPRRTGAGPIRTRDSFFCKSYEAQE